MNPRLARLLTEISSVGYGDAITDCIVKFGIFEIDGADASIFGRLPS